jgi:hypothetical protein
VEKGDGNENELCLQSAVWAYNNNTRSPAGVYRREEKRGANWRESAYLAIT